MWSGARPAEEALGSTLPFCCDTLAIEQWLQFVFLPRMAALVEAGGALPDSSAIRPMLSETLALPEAEMATLLQLVGDLDELLSR